MLRSTLTPKKRPAQPPRRASLLTGGRKNAPSKALGEFSDLMKDRLLDLAVDLIIAARKESANGRIRRDTMAVILNGLPPDYTRDMIYNREKKRRRVEEEILDTTNAVASANSISPADDVSELVPALRNKGGRPLGTTKEAKRDREERENKAKTDAVEAVLAASISPADDVPELVPATNEAKRDREERENMAKADAVQALLARWAVREPGRRNKKNELKLIIEAAKKKFNVEDFFIGESMIRERATRGKVSNPTSRGRVSPMAEIEPLLVTFVICLQRIGQPLNPTTFLELANSLTKGTPLEEKILASKHGGKSGAANGKSYFTGFMKRNKDEIDFKCPRKFPADRTTYTTYPNIESMYDMVYAVLVEVGASKSNFHHLERCRYLPLPTVLPGTGALAVDATRSL
jgi:hypothetical protein